MFEPVLAVAFILLMVLVYFVGLALGMIGGAVWDSIKELVRGFRG